MGFSSPKPDVLPDTVYFYDLKSISLGILSVCHQGCQPWLRDGSLRGEHKAMSEGWTQSKLSASVSELARFRAVWGLVLHFVIVLLWFNEVAKPWCYRYFGRGLRVGRIWSPKLQTLCFTWTERSPSISHFPAAWERPTKCLYLLRG